MSGIGAGNPYRLRETPTDQEGVADSGAIHTSDVTGRTELYYTDDSGNDVQLTDAGSVAGAATPGGADTQVQFNDSGAFGGSANFTWINQNLVLGSDTPVAGWDAGLTVSSDSSAIAICQVWSSTATDRGHVEIRKFGGTEASPADIGSGDLIGQITMSGTRNTGAGVVGTQAYAIKVEAAAAPDATGTPGKVEHCVYTGDAGPIQGGITIEGVSSAVRLGFYNGTTAVVQPAAVTKPVGGVTVDAEARTAIDTIIDILSAAGGGIGITA